MCVCVCVCVCVYTLKIIFDASNIWQLFLANFKWHQNSTHQFLRIFKFTTHLPSKQDTDHKLQKYVDVLYIWITNKEASNPHLIYYVITVPYLKHRQNHFQNTLRFTYIHRYVRVLTGPHRRMFVSPFQARIYSDFQDSVFTWQKTHCIFVTYKSCFILYETQKQTMWAKIQLFLTLNQKYVY